jgi:hypothetical protein
MTAAPVALSLSKSRTIQKHGRSDKTFGQLSARVFVALLSWYEDLFRPSFAPTHQEGQILRYTMPVSPAGLHATASLARPIRAHRYLPDGWDIPLFKIDQRSQFAFERRASSWRALRCRLITRQPQVLVTGITGFSIAIRAMGSKTNGDMQSSPPVSGTETSLIRDGRVVKRRL